MTTVTATLAELAAQLNDRAAANGAPVNVVDDLAERFVSDPACYTRTLRHVVAHLGTVKRLGDIDAVVAGLLDAAKSQERFFNVEKELIYSRPYQPGITGFAAPAPSQVFEAFWARRAPHVALVPAHFELTAQSWDRDRDDAGVPYVSTFDVGVLASVPVGARWQAVRLPDGFPDGSVNLGEERYEFFAFDGNVEIRSASVWTPWPPLG